MRASRLQSKPGMEAHPDGDVSTMPGKEGLMQGRHAKTAFSLGIPKMLCYDDNGLVV